MDDLDSKKRAFTEMAKMAKSMKADAMRQKLHGLPPGDGTTAEAAAAQMDPGEPPESPAAEAAEPVGMDAVEGEPVAEVDISAIDPEQLKALLADLAPAKRSNMPQPDFALAARA